MLTCSSENDFNIRFHQRTKSLFHFLFSHYLSKRKNADKWNAGIQTRSWMTNTTKSPIPLFIIAQHWSTRVYFGPWTWSMSYICLSLCLVFLSNKTSQRLIFLLNAKTSNLSLLAPRPKTRADGAHCSRLRLQGFEDETKLWAKGDGNLRARWKTQLSNCSHGSLKTPEND